MTDQDNQRTRALLSFLEQSAQLVVLDLDADDTVVAANEHARQLLGEACLGRHFRELLIEAQVELDLEQIWQRSMQPQLLSFSCSSGMPESLSVRSYPTTGGRVVVGQHDLDELHQLRGSLMEMNHELSNLSRQQQKSNAELQRLNELKNQFLGMAAHDLRNPIATIYTYTSLFLDDEERQIAPDMRQVLTDLRSLSEFMLHLISDLLDISVIEMGRLLLEKQPVEPVSLLQQIISLNRLFAQRNKIELVAEIALLPALIRIDPHKLKQVLNNLISNGIKFSPPGSSVLLQAALAGDRLRVTVQDQGPGLSQQEQEKLFKPFGRGNAIPQHGESSTGLGLAISRRIVEAHNGEIGVISEPGKGATFWFELPL